MVVKPQAKVQHGAAEPIKMRSQSMAAEPIKTQEESLDEIIKNRKRNGLLICIDKNKQNLLIEKKGSMIEEQRNERSQDYLSFLL